MKKVWNEYGYSPSTAFLFSKILSYITFSGGNGGNGGGGGKVGNGGNSGKYSADGSYDEQAFYHPLFYGEN